VHQFQGQKIKGQGNQADYCWDRKCIKSTEREGLRTSKLLRRSSMLSTTTASYKGLQSWVIARGRGIPCRPNPAAKQLVSCSVE